MLRINDFWSEESGAAATEYALMVGLIALVIAATLTTFGNSVLGLFTFGRIADTIASAS
jgi:Flp pilus assembly pilin Flp